MLTRLLYLVEHVKQNIVECILHNDKDELCYWLAEYYYSGYENECMEWITQIYYQYYALTYPSFESYISKKRILFKEQKKYTILVVIANNLRIKQSTPIYHNSIQQPTQTHRGRKPSWFHKYPDSIKILLFLYSKKDWNKVYSIIQSSNHDTLHEFYKAMCLYNNNHQPIDEDFYNYYKTITNDYTIETLKIMIFATCLHLSHPENPIINEYSTWLPNKKYLNAYTTLNTNTQPYNILKLNVKYKTRQSIPLSQLTDILTNWIYYSYDTPIWRERILQYSGIKTSNRIEFNTDDEHEQFYDTYGYELDEQNNNIYSLLYSVSYQE